jgi:hypothetical protein
MPCPSCCKFSLFCLEECPDDCADNCADCCESCKDCTVWLPNSGLGCSSCGAKSELPVDIKELAAIRYLRNNPNVEQFKNYISENHVPPDFEAIRNEFIERLVVDIMSKNNAIVR